MQLDHIAEETGPVPKDVLSKSYAEMRRMARRILADNVLGRAFQPTDLANEASIRLIRANLADTTEEGHFLAITARMMRQILIDEARKAATAKRQAPVLTTAWPGQNSENLMVDLAELDEALASLAEISPERAEIVEMRFMLGMTVEEAARATGIPERSVKRHWQAARAWLLGWLNDRSS
jgi:RNA polymerase sigma factor (TIGR02999 family)